MDREGLLKRIWEKTQGHCHFCGDSIDFEKRGWRNGGLAGYWETDHVIQRGKGGSLSLANCLPACTKCNRLRWHRKGKGLRELLYLGLIAKCEIKKRSRIGKMFLRLKSNRLSQNKKRRKQIK